jgi:hypothetical protein
VLPSQRWSCRSCLKKRATRTHNKRYQHKTDIDKHDDDNDNDEEAAVTVVSETRDVRRSHRLVGSNVRYCENSDRESDNESESDGDSKSSKDTDSNSDSEGVLDSSSDCALVGGEAEHSTKSGDPEEGRRRRKRRTDCDRGEEEEEDICAGSRPKRTRERMRPVSCRQRKTYRYRSGADSSVNINYPEGLSHSQNQHSIKSSNRAEIMQNNNNKRDDDDVLVVDASDDDDDEDGEEDMLPGGIDVCNPNKRPRFSVSSERESAGGVRTGVYTGVRARPSVSASVSTRMGEAIQDISLSAKSDRINRYGDDSRDYGGSSSGGSGSSDGSRDRSSSSSSRGNIGGGVGSRRGGGGGGERGEGGGSLAVREIASQQPQEDR